MKINLSILIFFLLILLPKTKAQDFFVCTGSGELRKVQINDCSSQIKASNSLIFNDITFHPSGKLYGITSSGSLFEVDTLGIQRPLLVVNLTTGGTNFNSLTCNAQGLIYATGGSGDLFTYNPQTQTVNSLGFIKVNNQVVAASGDLTFYDGGLYVASIRKLIKINLADPTNSTDYMTFSIGRDIFGIVSFAECGYVKTYVSTSETNAKIYQIDWVNRVLLATCTSQTKFQIYGGASRYEFDASRALKDSTRLTSFTCDSTLARVLPPRVFRAANGCDSFVIETIKFVKVDTTINATFTCDPTKVIKDTTLFKNSKGCDSVSIRNQLIAPRLSDNLSLDKRICSGDYISIGQNRFYTEGSFRVVLKNIFGCDSTVNLALKLVKTDTVIFRPETCDATKIKDSVKLFKNQFGCDSSVFIKPKLIANTNTVNGLPKDLKLVIGDSVELMPQLNFTPNLIQWTPPNMVSCSTCPTVFSRVKRNTILQFYAKDEKDCAVKQEIRFLVDLNRRVYIPNSFSPNGDRINDIFTLYGDGNLASIESLRVFDRWGELVYSGTNLTANSEGWDGQFKGQILPPDVFVFFAKLTFKDGETELFKGEINLVK